MYIFSVVILCRPILFSLINYYVILIERTKQRGSFKVRDDIPFRSGCSIDDKFFIFGCVEQIRI